MCTVKSDRAAKRHREICNCSWINTMLLSVTDATEKQEVIQGIKDSNGAIKHPDRAKLSVEGTLPKPQNIRCFQVHVKYLPIQTIVSTVSLRGFMSQEVCSRTMC